MTEAYRYWSEEITMDDIASRKTDDKDALEELRKAIVTVDTACRIGLPSAGMEWGAVAFRMGAAIAAWEKERADMDYLVGVSNSQFEREHTLRAAVEKVPEVWERARPHIPTFLLNEFDGALVALRAALRGGE